MKVRNPHALYINCDGAMDYDRNNTGGVGFVITFPDNVQMDEIQISKGHYEGGNIERIEYEAIIQAMNYVIKLYERHKNQLSNIRQIIFISDRYALNDNERTNPYKIKEWRRNKWKNFEGKPIKNHELLNKLDKTRKKLAEKASARVNIEYRPRKQNKVADKLAKAGKSGGIKDLSLAKKGEKIGKRKFTGDEIKYIKLEKGNYLHLHVFRKDPVQELWEVWTEIVEGDHQGQKLKIYADDKLASKLQRKNQFIVKIKEVFRHHIIIYRKITKIKKG